MRTTLVAAAALLLAAAGFAAAQRGRPQAAATTIRVTAYDFRFSLSRASAPVGPVRFVVVNRGVFPHDFAIAGRRTPRLAHGKSAVLTVVFRRAARFAYLCSVPGHAAAGMRGVLTIARRPAAVTTAPTTAAPVTTTTPGGAGRLTKIGDFARPVFVTAPLGDSHRVFVVEQRGIIRQLVDDELRPRPFLDLSGQVVEVSERGLLSMAFAPDYARSGKFYVDYTDAFGNGTSTASSTGAQPKIRTLPTRSPRGLCSTSSSPTRTTTPG